MPVYVLCRRWVQNFPITNPADTLPLSEVCCPLHGLLYAPGPTADAGFLDTSQGAGCQCSGAAWAACRSLHPGGIAQGACAARSTQNTRLGALGCCSAPCQSWQLAVCTVHEARFASELSPTRCSCLAPCTWHSPLHVQVQSHDQHIKVHLQALLGHHVAHWGRVRGFHQQRLGKRLQRHHERLRQVHVVLAPSLLGTASSLSCDACVLPPAAEQSHVLGCCLQH